MNVYEKLQEIFIDVFDDEDIVVTAELSAADIEDWDSLAQIRLVESIEDEFGFTFDMDELAKAKNVGEMVAIIGANINR